MKMNISRGFFFFCSCRSILIRLLILFGSICNRGRNYILVCYWGVYKDKLAPYSWAAIVECRNCCIQLRIKDSLFLHTLHFPPCSIAQACDNYLEHRQKPPLYSVRSPLVLVASLSPSFSSSPPSFSSSPVRGWARSQWYCRLLPALELPMFILGGKNR